VVKGGGKLLLAASALTNSVASQASETIVYTYDALGRLTATAGSGTVNDGDSSALTYDPAGNRKAYSVSGGSGGTPPPGGLGVLGAQPAGVEPAAVDAAASPDSAECEEAAGNSAAGTDAPTDDGVAAEPCQ
jgi:hypothetical protein